MATCQFCQRQFRNTQAVRAHLKACPTYHDRDQVLSPALGSAALGTVPEATSAGAEFADEDAGRQDRREAARERAQERADRQAEREIGPFLRRVTEERRARHRRELIQSVKNQTIGAWSWQHPTIPADVKADALLQIERKLSGLPLEELPRHEVVRIAEGVRDRLFRPVLEAQEVARRRARAEEEAGRRAKLDEDAAHRREEAAARERAEAKQRLLERGMSVVDRELRADPDLDPTEREHLRKWVQGELENELNGEESREDVDDLVDNILEEELGGNDEDDLDDELDEDDGTDDEEENDDD
jgi:hypothetical protein